MNTGGKRSKLLPLTRALWWPVGGLVLPTCVHGRLKGHHCPCLDTEETGWSFMCHLHPLLCTKPRLGSWFILSQQSNGFVTKIPVCPGPKHICPLRTPLLGSFERGRVGPWDGETPNEPVVSSKFCEQIARRYGKSPAHRWHQCIFVK